MAITLVTSSKHTITVEDQPFAKGGEGKIHKVTASSITYKDCCVKLYEPKYRTPERLSKIAFLIQNRPAHLQNNDYMVCFPKELVFLNNQFVGFIMPLAFKDSIQLEALCTPGIRPVYKHHQKFDRNRPDAFRSRLQLCLNLAVPVHLVHSLDKYVFVDIKPQNILVSPNSRISIIDIDSIQIANQQQIIHPAQVNTPDYSPPEWWHVTKGKYIPEAWDRFAAAVIFYQILLGVHPYAATFKSPYANVNEIPQKIKNGLFVHGHNSYAVSVLPPPHQAFPQLDTRLQGLFMGAFEVGLYDASKRPTINQWGQAFDDVLKSNKPIKNPTPPNIATAKPIKNPIPLNTATATPPPPPPPSMIYAGFWQRLAAFSLDTFILGIVVLWIRGLSESGMDEFGAKTLGIIVDALLKSGIVESEANALAIIIAGSIYYYFSLMESSSTQGTLGKMAVGIKVINLQGNKIGFGKALWRCFCAAILFSMASSAASGALLIIACISFIMVAWTEKKQALHDKITGCLVVKK